MSGRVTRHKQVRIAAGLLLGLTFLTRAYSQSAPEPEPVSCGSEPTNLRLNFDELLTCDIGVLGDSDLFSFTGLFGDVMVVQATALTTGDDICVEVFDPGFTQIANECAVQSARADVKLPSSGSYVIRVSDLNSDDTPAYAIIVDRVSPPTSTTTPVEFNQIANGAIEPLGDADQYSAVGAAGDLFIVQATGQNPGDDLCVRVFGPTGDRLAEACGSPGARADVTLTNSGTHTIRVTDTNSDGTPRYTLNVECLGTCFSTGPVPIVFSLTNGASFLANSLTPGAIATIFGDDLATANAQAQAVPLPTLLGATSVTINGIPAPLFFVSPEQINLQVPYEIPAGAASVAVDVGGLGSGGFPVDVSSVAPGVFLLEGNRCVVQNEDLKLNSSADPAAVDSVIVVYLTGQGALDNPVATGQAAPDQPLSRAVLTTAAMIGGEDADLLFLGLTPRLVAVSQANIRVPDVSAGDRQLVITVDGVSSNACLVSVAGDPGGDPPPDPGGDPPPDPGGDPPPDLPPPVILSVSPDNGSSTGGTLLTIAGENFQDGAQVSVGGALAPLTLFINSSTLQASTPAGELSGGAVGVTVMNPDGKTATLGAAFTYTGTAN